MTTILDHRGQPLQRDALQEPQTAHLSHLHSEFENHPSRGLTPQRLARIMQAAEHGDLLQQHELYQDVEEKDGHIFSVMQTRRLTLQGLEWDIKAPEGSGQAGERLAADAKAMLTSMSDFEDVLFDMGDAIGHGFSALELRWGRDGRDRLPLTATHRPQAWFTLPTSYGSDRNELRLRSSSTEGEPLWPFGWIVHLHKSRSGYLARMGLYRMLVWPFIFKNYAVRDLAEFLEIYGLPLRLGTYSPSASEADKGTLLRAVTRLGHDSAAIIPQGMMIDFKDAAQGDNKAFDSMISHMERVASKVVLGGTLTSGEGQNGTQALGKIHNEVRHDILKSDARQLAASLTSQLIYPMLALNRGLSDPRACPRLVFDTQEPEDVKLYADAIPKLAQVGMRIPRSWAHDKLKIPQAETGDQDVLTPPPRTGVADGGAPDDGAPGRKPPAGKARMRLAPQAASPDELDELANDMLAEWVDGMGELVEPVEAALANATSFEDFSRALEAGLAQIEADKLVDLLARGTFAARIWGQLNQVNRPTNQE